MATRTPRECNEAKYDTPVARLAVALISWQATAAFRDRAAASPDTTVAASMTNYSR
jgi:hypothetical protein